MMKVAMVMSVLSSLVLMGCQIEITPTQAAQFSVNGTQQSMPEFINIDHDNDTVSIDLAETNAESFEDTDTQPETSQGIQATAVTLYWSEPSMTQGNEALSPNDLLGYKVRYRLNDETVYRDVMFIADASQTQVYIDNLAAESVYYFEVAAVNQLGMVGQYQAAFNYRAIALQNRRKYCII